MGGFKWLNAKMVANSQLRMVGFPADEHAVVDQKSQAAEDEHEAVDDSGRG
jgi:hypothetical protein